MTEPIDEALARLLRETGRRPSVAQERSARVYGHLRASWRRSVSWRRRVRVAGLVAAAASVAALILAWVTFRTTPEPAAVAVLERGRPSDAAMDLRVGSVVSTHDGERLAIRTATSHSIRLDGGSRLRLVSGRAVALEEGAVYVDSGDSSPAAVPLEVMTPFGTVQEHGTQYESRLANGALEVHVREGKVALRVAGGELVLGAGEAVRVDATGSRRLPAEEAFGPRWDWVQDAAPRPVLDGRTLSGFLSWYARESGRHVRFADDDTAGAAAGTILSGAIDAMSLDEALESVLAASGMRATRSGRELLVESSAH